LLTVAQTVKHAARIITVSEFSRDAILRAYDIPPNKVSVIPNAANPHFRAIGREKAQQAVRNRLKFSAPFVFSVGDLQPRKNQIGLIKAFAEKLRSGWQRACDEMSARVPIIFTAHSVPQRTIAEGDPYEAQTKETAQLVARDSLLAAADWKFAFQSQGMSGGTWLGPTVESTILELKEKGHRGVFIQPIGFLCDHVEVLYDIDIGFKQFARSEGMQLWRAESLNDSPWLTAALADLARSRIGSPVEK